MIHITPEEARRVAKEAYIFGASYVDNYRIYIKAPVDEQHPLPGLYTCQSETKTLISWLMT
jgi:hypothetical protein